MKAALSRYRSRGEDVSPRLSREEARVKEAKWAQRQSDLEAKLHSLAHQRDSLSPEDRSDLQDSLQGEARKNRELMEQVKALRARNEQLEKTNKSLTMLLVEKDGLVGRYMNEMLRLRGELERVNKSDHIKESVGDFGSALDDFRGFSADDDILDEWPAAKPNAPVGKEAHFRASGHSSVFEVEESRFSLNSWKQSRASSELRPVMRNSRDAREELTRTGTFGEEQMRAETRKMEMEVERLREMLESAERELIMEKQERVMLTDSKEKLERECEGLKSQNADLRSKLEVSTDPWKPSASDSSLISSLQSELTEARALIVSLQTDLDQFRRDPNPFSPPQDSNTLQAIQQLSLMILSKDKSSMVDPQTKSLVQSVFGDNFSNLVNAYEQKVAKLEEEVKDLRDVYRAELQKHLRHLDMFQDTVDFLMELRRLGKEEDGEEVGEVLEEMSEKYEQLQGEIAAAVTDTKLQYEEMGVMSIRNSEYSSPAKKPAYMSINSELEQMRTKVSLLTSENVSLLQKTRLLQSRESELDRIRKSLNEHKAEKRKITSENEKLKQDLTQALSSNNGLSLSLQRLEYRLKTELQSDDLFAVLQTQASVVEEILNQQQQTESEALEDFDAAFDL